ncbi:MAG: S1/P1 nuclease [Candidatus Binatus sp.]|uniref:S1/P1 nuclease n=1 Tax=Candidatus Binatus sp. TaxID=2811406 RepID=UPI0027260B8E|nr:S1/P1 nuclease [Candidatus Binatus sp.]MDO8433151.1 S1/P1 nuclease [Candidatus Binatus sp.]
MKRAGAIALAILALLARHAPPALAWDNRTHREITHLAIAHLPPSPLKDFFFANDDRLRQISVEPDSILKHRDGKAEQIRHYINIEYFGSDPFDALVPDLHAMEKKFGAATIKHAGTLPWTIDDLSSVLRDAWSRGDCARVLQTAGYLAHYVGDASQPLHSTILYDGYRRDRGMHARVELAVDDRIDELGAAANRETKLISIDSVWPPTIAEIREANTHVEEFIQADRAARNSGSRSQYDDAFLRREKPLIVSEIARAASLLASIWLFEWQQSHSPVRCKAAAN